MLASSKRSWGLFVLVLCVSFAMMHGGHAIQSLSPQQPGQVKVEPGGVVPRNVVMSHALYTAVIDSVQRSGEPSTIVPFTPRVFSLPGPDVLYDRTEVTVGFSVTNLSTSPLNGYVSASIRGHIHDSTNPSSFKVENIAPGASVAGQVSAGLPPGAGTQVVHLYWRNASTPPLPGGGFEWTETDTHEVDVLATPPYVKRAPYDLVYEEVDLNGFPRNPRFGKQDEYWYRTGSRDLWMADARPDILKDCYNHAEPQDFNGINNDYDAFRNGYCKHSPGVLNSQLNPYFCKTDTQADGYKPGGDVWCASFAWKDTPWAGKCGVLGSTDMNDIGGDGGFVVTFHNSGHENFGVVTYDGILNWDNAQDESYPDSDWCMDLYTPHGAGVTGRLDGRPGTADADRFVHTEFDPKNVGDKWDHGFWGGLAAAIHKAQVPAGVQCSRGFGFWGMGGCQVTNDQQRITVAPKIDGHRAIVIGLLGIDVGHNDASGELHPVYGMAIHAGGTPLDQVTGKAAHDGGPVQDVYLHPEGYRDFDVPQDPNDDMWAIWATNFGSEGYCSTRTVHVLDGDQSIIGRKEFPTMAFRIPWARDKYGQDMQNVELLWPQTGFVMVPQVNIGMNQANWQWAIDRGPRKAIVITFELAPSAAQANWYGELHLRWTPGPPPSHEPGHEQPVIPTASPAATKAQQHPMGSGMTGAQQRAFTTAMINSPRAKAPDVLQAIVGTPRMVQVAPQPSVRPLPHTLPTTGGKFTTGPGPSAEDAAARRALCAAYRGSVPHQPADFCRQ